VADGADVNVRLVTFKLGLGHNILPFFINSSKMIR